MGSQVFVDAAGENDMPLVIMTALSNALRCCSIWEALGSMYKFGACIIPSGVSHRDLDALAWFMPNMRRRTRGDGRWTVTEDGFAENEFFKPFTYSSAVTAIVDALDASTTHGHHGPHYNWERSRTGGDIVEPHAYVWQPIHSDDSGYSLNTMERGYAISISIAVTDIPIEFGPMRFIPWCQLKRYEDFPQVDSRGPINLAADCQSRCCEHLVTMRKRDLLIRDVRVAHSGSVNRTGSLRALPGMQIYSSQYLAFNARRWGSCQ